MNNYIFIKSLVLLNVAFIIGVNSSSTVISYSINLENYLDKPTESGVGRNIMTSTGTEKQFEYLGPRLITREFLFQEILRNRQKENIQKSQGNFNPNLPYSWEKIWTYARNDGNYTPHQPIKINKNADFTYANGVVSGNGTIDNPYIIEGWVINNTGPVGIQIQHTTLYFIVRNCLIQNGDGIYLIAITNGTVARTMFNCSGSGVMILGSSNVCIKDSEIYAGFEVFISGSMQVVVDNCSIFSSNYFATGVQIESSSSNVLSNLTVFDNQNGIQIRESQHNIIKDCDVFSNQYGISIVDSPHQILRNNSFLVNTYNLGLIYGSNVESYYHDIDTSNTINGKPIYYLRNESNLVIDEGDDISFLGLINCNNITVDSFTPASNVIGMLLVGSQYSSVLSSVFVNNPVGVVLFYSSNNSFNRCDFTDSGINLIDSPHNIFRNATIASGFFSVDGETLDDFYQNVDLSNTVDGKPIYYFIEKKDMIFSNSEVGFLAFVNCTNITVIGLHENNLNGLLLATTNGTVKNSEIINSLYGGVYVFGESLLTIKNCWIHDDYFGFAFNHASKVTIEDCIISTYLVGFDLRNSSGNEVKNCIINGIPFNAFQIIDSWNNTICCNTISKCYGGFILDGNSWGNEISYHFISNGNYGISMGPSSPISPHDNTIHHNSLMQMDFYAIGLDSADNNNIYRNTIQDSGYGIYISRSQNCLINWNNINDNDVGLRVEIDDVDATNNWWGSKDGPSGIGPGSGDSISVASGAKVLYEPWLKHRALGSQLITAVITHFLKLALYLKLFILHVKPTGLT